MMVCHVSPMWNETPKAGVASQLFSCSSALSRVRAAVTRGWSFPVLPVCFHPWLWAHISLLRAGPTTLGWTKVPWWPEYWGESGWRRPQSDLSGGTAHIRNSVPPHYYLICVRHFIPDLIRSKGVACWGCWGDSVSLCRYFWKELKHRCKQKWAGFVSKHVVLHEIELFKLTFQRNDLHYSD